MARLEGAVAQGRTGSWGSPAPASSPGVPRGGPEGGIQPLSRPLGPVPWGLDHLAEAGPCLFAHSHWTPCTLPAWGRTTSPRPPAQAAAEQSPRLPMPSTPRTSLAQNQLADGRGWAGGGRGRGPACRGHLGWPMAGRLVGVGHLPVTGHVGAGGHHRPPGETALILAVVRAGAWGGAGVGQLGRRSHAPHPLGLVSPGCTPWVP